MSRDGVTLNLGGDAPVALKVAFHNLLGDEEALSSLWFIKGASGISPCGVGCSVVNKQNLFDRSAGIRALTDDPEIKDISSSVMPLRRTDNDVWGLCQELQACPTAEMEHVTGLKLNLDGILFDNDLRHYIRPASTNTYDVMHILFSNGLVGTEMMLFFKNMREEVGAYIKDVREVVAEARWLPATEVFSENREKHATDHIKAGASELLAAYPLLRWFILQAYGAAARTTRYVISILLLFQICDVVRHLLKYVSREEVEAASRRLEQLVREYLEAFVSAHGRDTCRFKHHQLLHLPYQLLRDGFLLNTWVLERKHIVSKQSMSHNRSLSHIENTALSRCFNHQLRKLEDPGWASKLVGRQRLFPELAESLSAQRVLIARGLRWRGTEMNNSELLFLDSEKSNLFVVIAGLHIDESFGMLVRCCDKLTRTTYSSTWRVQPEVKVYCLVREHVFKTAFHRFLSSDQVEVLH
jgi:hypothetical protein